MERIFSKNKTTFCYCISEYPLEFKKIDWKKAVKYDGFSDHTSGITAPILFTILKKQKKSKQILIEDQETFANKKSTTLHKSSSQNSGSAFALLS